MGKIFATKNGGTPPTNLQIKKYKNSFFLIFCVKLLNFFSNFFSINSFKKKLANKYKHVAPIVKEIETTNPSETQEQEVQGQGKILKEKNRKAKWY